MSFQLHLVDTDYSIIRCYKKELYINKGGSRIYDSKKLLLITDDSKVNEWDVVLKPNGQVRYMTPERMVDFLDSQSNSTRKIIASSSSFLTPNNLISNKDIESVIDYFNKNGELPNKFIIELLISPLDKKVLDKTLHKINNEIIIHWEHELKENL